MESYVELKTNLETLNNRQNIAQQEKRNIFASLLKKLSPHRNNLNYNSIENINLNNTAMVMLKLNDLKFEIKTLKDSVGKEKLIDEINKTKEQIVSINNEQESIRNEAREIEYKLLKRKEYVIAKKKELDSSENKLNKHREITSLYNELLSGHDWSKEISDSIKSIVDSCSEKEKELITKQRAIYDDKNLIKDIRELEEHEDNVIEPKSIKSDKLQELLIEVINEIESETVLSKEEKESEEYVKKENQDLTLIDQSIISLDEGNLNPENNQLAEDSKEFQVLDNHQNSFLEEKVKIDKKIKAVLNLISLAAKTTTNAINSKILVAKEQKNEIRIEKRINIEAEKIYYEATKMCKKARNIMYDYLSSDLLCQESKNNLKRRVTALLDNLKEIRYKYNTKKLTESSITETSILTTLLRNEIDIVTEEIKTNKKNIRINKRKL